MNAKYVNAIPLYRLEQEFKRVEVNISRQVMANWVIRCAERYLSLVWNRLHQELYRSPVIQADETPVLVNKDGRSAGAKSYMWVYRTGKMYDAALQQISAIYKIEEELKDLSPEERVNRRQLSVKPLVDFFFAWVKANC
uniref:IS66 family transposase n=1 Tax=Cellulosilyticum ruminicola TaxID=425254 RepID=UPI0006D07CE9|nr:transposase [Cellulosilyticum ruminicola]